MGLAASQARLLVLTARKSDLEYRAQNITNRKLLLSAQTEQIATEYTKKLNNRQMRFVFDYDAKDMQDINENLTIDSIYTNNNAFVGQYRVKLADGRIAVSDVNQLGFAIKQDGTIQTQSSREIFASLSEQEKFSYFQEAIQNITTLGNAGEATAEAQDLINSKVTTEKIGNIPAGSAVIDRKTQLTGLLTELYALTGNSNKSLTVTDSDNNPTINIIKDKDGKAISSFINNINADEKGQKLLKVITEIMTMDNLPDKIKENFSKYLKELDSSASNSAAFPASDPTNNDLAAAIYAINDYVLNTANAAQDSFLTADVAVSSSYSYITQTITIS